MSLPVLDNPLIIMKRLLLVWSCTAALAAHAATSITPANHFAYGANLGWMDWRGDVNNCAVIGEYVCSGCLYAANVGWIHLGDGTPANRIQYQNNSGSTIRRCLTVGNAAAGITGSGLDGLNITECNSEFNGNETNTLTWTSKPTRNYQLNWRVNLNTNPFGG
jgi:hypothetical protein